MGVKPPTGLETGTGWTITAGRCTEQRTGSTLSTVAEPLPPIPAKWVWNRDGPLAATFPPTFLRPLEMIGGGGATHWQKNIAKMIAKDKAFKRDQGKKPRLA